MDNLIVQCLINIEKRARESDELALERLQGLLESELENLTDHCVSCEVQKIVYD